MARKKFRPAWWAVIVVALLSALMIGLGVWQLQRGFAKQALLDRYQQASVQDAVPITAGHVARENEIERAYVRGRFDTARQLLLDNQSHDGVPGYHVWTPLVQDDGSTVIVDRGWISHDTAQLPDVLAAPDARVEIHGFWRTPPVPGMRLKTDNCAALPWPRTVEYPTLADLQCVYGQFVAPGILLMDPAESDGYVRDWQTAPELNPTKHYGYAGQWFAFTLTLLVIFIKMSFRVPTPQK
ncbi:SURF1 family protein [Solimonas terrae]|uniref:SURF1-like protein n=1 Tax=Solimonas terrae TaxID=1396819 RepID=A0A6M2BSY5_9GAMM|nr:SURF1 family protein [Solimonas terrae]NGY05077.1 SURF1 family protein [Solimonas terrae]